MLTLEDRFEGCMVGHLVGDAVGEGYSGAKIKWHENVVMKGHVDVATGIKYPKGYPSEAAANTYCLARSLLERGWSPEDQYERYGRWFREGYGTPGGKTVGHSERMAHLLAAEPELDAERMKIDDSAITGAEGLMRMAPIPLYYHGRGIDVIAEKAEEATAVTNNNGEVELYSAIFSVLIELVLNGNSKGECVEQLRDFFRDEVSVALLGGNELWAKPDCKSDFFQARTVLRVAIWSWLCTVDYKAAVSKAVKRGVNMATLGSVAGALAGATYGYDDIPPMWRFDSLMREDFYSMAQGLRLSSLWRDLPD
jgi:ADP-ribosyl-[dinitrogen reductase] hydrolase